MPQARYTHKERKFALTIRSAYTMFSSDNFSIPIFSNIMMILSSRPVGSRPF